MTISVNMKIYIHKVWESPKFIDLQRALQPHNIKTLKHGPSFNTVMVNKSVAPTTPVDLMVIMAQAL
jgi:hypothetical protein